MTSQSVTSKGGNGSGGPRYRPYAFTEQGVAMLSSVLQSERAIEVNIAIMRTFCSLRQILSTHEELARRMDELAWRQEEQDQQVQVVFDTIQHLIEGPEDEPKRRIGSRRAKSEKRHSRPAVYDGHIV